MKRLQVLVCGTNYGRAYLRAIGRQPAAYSLMGILARGSPRSLRFARQLGVPLYREVEDLPAGIDLACAAMGASGGAAVLSLLERGIHVLCEHPQKAAWLRAAFRKAAAHNACFHLNGHFAELEAPRLFIRHCRHLRQTAAPALLNMMATDRSLYAALDILSRALGRLLPARSETLSRQPPFILIRGRLAGIPTTSQVQCWSRAGSRGLRDGDPRYLVDLRIAACFPAGTLTLLSMSGPVVWNTSPAWQAAGEDELWERIGAQRPAHLRRLGEQRLQANLRAMGELVRSARKHIVPPQQRPARLLEVSRVWEQIGKKLRG
jgi:thiazolinyl reductase component of yersiniabactin synthetase